MRQQDVIFSPAGLGTKNSCAGEGRPTCSHHNRPIVRVKQFENDGRIFIKIDISELHKNGHYPEDCTLHFETFFN
jgi:hypothetical protein